MDFFELGEDDKAITLLYIGSVTFMLLTPIF